MNNLVSLFLVFCLAGSPFTNIVGFIDGTARTARPSVNQQNFYSGHKRHHVIKYQAVTLPNGIIARVDGPYQERRHDSYMLTSSGILEHMQQKWAKEDGRFYHLFGDKGHTNSKFVVFL